MIRQYQSTIHNALEASPLENAFPEVLNKDQHLQSSLEKILPDDLMPQETPAQEILEPTPDPGDTELSEPAMESLEPTPNSGNAESSEPAPADIELKESTSDSANAAAPQPAKPKSSGKRA